MLLTNYHTHTIFCDGVEEPLSYALEAVHNNMKTLGFSAHAPVPFNCTWTLPVNKYQAYVKAINELKDLFKDKLEILCGLEIDYIPGCCDEILAISNPGTLDYFIGSIHFIDSFPDGTPWTIDGSNIEFQKGWKEIFDMDSHAVVRKYFAYTRDMLRLMKPDIVGHLDKIKMQHNQHCFIPETDPVYQKEAIETLEAIKAAGCVVEINTRGMYRRQEPDLYPSFWLLQKMAAMNIPVTINSDAHRPRELISLFNHAQAQLQKAGFDGYVYLTEGEWRSAKFL